MNRRLPKIMMVILFFINNRWIYPLRALNITKRFKLTLLLL